MEADEAVSTSGINRGGAGRVCYEEGLPVAAKILPNQSLIIGLAETAKMLLPHNCLYWCFSEVIVATKKAAPETALPVLAQVDR